MQVRLYIATTLAHLGREKLEEVSRACFLDFIPAFLHFLPLSN